MQYYIKLSGLEDENLDPNTLSSFKKMKNKIFSLAGYQNEINREFEITRVLMEFLNIPVEIHTPNLGRLSAIWHDCSEPCHIFWNMAAAANIEESDYDPYSDLLNYAKELGVFAEATVHWVRIRDAGLNETFKSFDGDPDCKAKIRKHFEKIGLYAEVIPNDGSKPYLVGTPIPVKNDTND